MKNIVFRELELNNFKCHEQMTFSFVPNRLVTIVGNNGAGKTTIFSALSWALYDSTIEGMSGDDVIRKRSGKDTFVKISWDDGDDVYEVHAYRKHHQHKNNRYLFKNNENVSGTSQKETLDKISQLIMPKDVFFNCLLFSQYAKNHFIDLTPGGRYEILDSMLLLHRFNDWFNKCGVLINETQQNIKSKELDIQTTTAKLSIFQKNLEEENMHTESLKTKYIESINEIDRQINDLNNVLIGLRQTDLDISSRQSELEILLSTKNSMDMNISEESQRFQHYKETLEMDNQNKILQLISKMNDELNAILENPTQRLSDLKNEFLDIKNQNQKKLLSLEENANSARKRDSDKRREELNPVEEKLSSTTIDIQKLKITIDNFVKDNDDLDNTLSNHLSHINQPNPICSLCKQSISGNSKIEIENKIKELEESKKKKVDALEKSRNDIILLENTLKELISSKNEIISRWDDSDKQLEERIRKAKENLSSEYIEKSDKISEEIENLSQYIEKQRKEHTDKKEKLVNDIKSDINEQIFQKQKSSNTTVSIIRKQLEDIISEIKAKEEVISNIQKTIHNIDLTEQNIKFNEKTKISQETAFIEATSVSKNKIDNLMKEIDKHNNMILEYTKDIENLKRREHILNFWKTAYSDTGIKSILLDDSIPILNEKAKELCNLTNNLKVRFDSQTALKSGDVRNKFGIEVLQTRNLSNLKELSSGEKRMADIIVLLCLRHLLEQIQNVKMNILLLDEILDSLDPENAFLAVSMVKKLSSDHCVALISHTLRDYIEADETCVL